MASYANKGFTNKPMLTNLPEGWVHERPSCVKWKPTRKEIPYWAFLAWYESKAYPHTLPDWHPLFAAQQQGQLRLGELAHPGMMDALGAYMPFPTDSSPLGMDLARAAMQQGQVYLGEQLAHPGIFAPGAYMPFAAASGPLPTGMAYSPPVPAPAPPASPGDYFDFFSSLEFMAMGFSFTSLSPWADDAADPTTTTPPSSGDVTPPKPLEYTMADMDAVLEPYIDEDVVANLAFKQTAENAFMGYMQGERELF